MPSIAKTAYVGRKKNIRDKAIIEHEAHVYDNAVVRDNAWVGNYASLHNSAVVRDRASVRGHAGIFGDAVVSDFAVVEGYAVVTDYAKVFGNAHVKGNAELRGHATVSHTYDYLTLGPSFIMWRTVTAHLDAKIGIRVNVGCFSNTLGKFRKAVDNKHKHSFEQHAQYMLFADMIEAHFALVKAYELQD